MYAGKTGTSSNLDYIFYNVFDISQFRYKNILSASYTVRNIDAGYSGGNSANLPAGLGFSFQNSYEAAQAAISSPIATATIARGVGTYTTFDLTQYVGIEVPASKFYLYLGSTSTANNTYKEFGGPDNADIENRPYIEITYLENNFVWYNNQPCEIYYCEDGKTWTKCAPYYCEDGARWIECGL